MHPTVLHAASSPMQRGLRAMTVVTMLSMMLATGSDGRAVPQTPGSGEPRLLKFAEKLLADSKSAFADYIREAMLPCTVQSGCKELLGKELPAMLPTNVNNCSRAALNTSSDLCLKNIWRNLKIFEMYLQLISDKSGGQLKINHIKSDMKHLLSLIYAKLGPEEKQDITDLKLAEEHLEELAGAWSKKVFTVQVLHLFSHQIEDYFLRDLWKTIVTNVM